MNESWIVPAFDQTLFKAKASRYCVIIPVINEGDRIQRQISKMRELAKTWDVIIVDGGSIDDSLPLEFLRNNNVRGLLVKTGPGKLSAQLRVGIAFAMDQEYAGVILMDGNDKDEPTEISKFAEALDQGFDHVQGSRFLVDGKAINNPWSRVLAIRLIHSPLMSIAAGHIYTDTTNGFRAYSRNFLLSPHVQPFRDIFNRYELHYYLAIRAPRLNFKIKEVGVTRIYPRGEIPTKISSVRGNMEIISTLLKACTGRFNPRPEAP
jgi:dolichol-phosphate mannosyltransferase